MDEASRRRRAAGGKLALGRPSATRAAYDQLRVALFRRSQGRCECCGMALGIMQAEVEHAVNRSQGSPDSVNDCWLACHDCNQRKLWPFAKGRLVVVVLGFERFRWELHWATDKWAPREITVLRER